MNMKQANGVVFGIGVTLAVTSLLVAGCSSSPAPAATTPAVTSPAANAAKPSASSSPTRDLAAMKAKGEEIFQKTAGGIGCQSCHGTDAKGKPNTAPDIRGETADDIRRALNGDAMSFIRLSNDDIEAVALYIQTLQ